MELIVFLVCFPFFSSIVLSLIKNISFRKLMVYAFSFSIAAVSIIFSTHHLLTGTSLSYLQHSHRIDQLMLAAEVGMTGLVVYFSFKYHKIFVAILSVLQAGLMLWLELISGWAPAPVPHLFVDNLTAIMCLIIGVVGTLICIYASGYMKHYHEHHKEVTDRQPFFFAMLFVFLGAMFGLVLSNNLSWIYFFWEITSLCSFLLIGYTRTEEAIENSFRAVWMNLLGGLGFAVAIVYTALAFNLSDLRSLVILGTTVRSLSIPVILLAFAGLTKSAQLPFSRWLLGAMVAPTPTSALLHSATMVKAGVYLLLRLSPAFYGNIAGVMVTTIGGFTFFATSLLAIAHSDGKKVLAYSTISNLGLITACAGVGMYEAVWAGILLMIFHAVSKSLLFQSVGAVENSTGSRNIEDMHGLVVRYPWLAFTMIVGIAGMFLAPFGMLISKWAALKAFIDSKSILLVVFLIYGSASTFLYWTKWLAKLIAVIHESERKPNVTGKSEWLSLLCHASLMIILCVTFPFVSTTAIEPYLMEVFHLNMPPIISAGNLHIMVMMLGTMVILPAAVRLLTFGKKHKVVISYMGGVNAGNDRSFIDAFGNPTEMYLASWYFMDYFSEKRLDRPIMILSTAVIAILMIIGIGGAI